VVCIQETKLEVVDEFLCRSLWGSSMVGFSYQPSIGATSGILSLWDTNEVEVWTTLSFENVLIIKGRFVKYNVKFDVVNVYAPCDSVRRQILWEKLTHLISNDRELPLYVVVVDCI